MARLWRQVGAASQAGDKAVMKTIGLIDGMSWQSTRTYYHLLNEMWRHVSAVFIRLKS